MPWSRASEIDRVLNCVGSLVLPRIDGEAPGEAAEWGNGMHRAWQYDSAQPTVGFENHGWQLEERLPIIRAHREKFWPGWSESRGSGTSGVGEAIAEQCGVVERAVAVYCGDGREPAVAFADGLNDEERDAWKAQWDDNWITGAMDFVSDDAILGDPIISDLKTGRDEERKGGPRERKQQWVYALAEWLITGADRVVANVVLHPRYPKADPPTALWATFLPDELRAFHYTLKAARRDGLSLRSMWEGDSGTLMPHLNASAENCRYCPSKRACPLERGELT